jgi:regulator of protease activity HflC (stomatin/prohibitin superfamily)
LSEAQLVEARTKAETQRIDAEAKAEARRVEAAAEGERQRLTAEADAAAERIRTTAEVEAVRQREQVAHVYTDSPALLRLRELETLRDLARVANARIYIGFDKHARLDRNGAEPDGD